MKVSVVIPSYNHGKFIAKAIQSVLDQTFQDFEIIITDDGSIDNTVDEIRKFNDPRIKLFVFSLNQGAHFAFKNCLKHAQGEYIALLSSDDYFMHTKLEKQVSFLDQNTDYAAVFTHARVIDELGNDLKDKDHFYTKVFDQKNRTRHQWLYKLFREGNFFCHPSVMIRKEFYDIKDFDPRLRQVPDYSFWIKLLMHADIYILQEKLTAFRVLDNEKNTSGTTMQNHIRTTYEMSKIIENFLEMTLDDYVEVFKQKELLDIPEEYICIPFLLAQKSLSTPGKGHKVFAVNTIFNLLGDSSTALTLKEKYNFTYNDFFDLLPKVDIFNQLSTWECSIDVDCGDGFKESNKINEVIQARNVVEFSLSFDLSRFKNVIAIRLNPIKGKRVKVKIDEVYCKSVNSENIFPATPFKSNYSLVHDSYYIFEVLNPWIEFRFSDSIDKSSFYIKGKWIIDDYQSLFNDYQKQKKQHTYADILRDAALYFEEKGDIVTAFKIMQESLNKRPEGPFIKQKLQEYKIIIEKSSLE